MKVSLPFAPNLMHYYVAGGCPPKRDHAYIAREKASGGRCDAAAFSSRRWRGHARGPGAEGGGRVVGGEGEGGDGGKDVSAAAAASPVTEGGQEELNTCKSLSK